MSELGMTEGERTAQLDALLSRRAYFDGLSKIICHSLSTDAEAGVAVTHVDNRYKSFFVSRNPAEAKLVTSALDLPEMDEWVLAYGSVGMGPVIYNAWGKHRPGLVSVAHSHPTVPGLSMLDTLTPSSQDLDLSNGIFNARPHAAMIIAAANQQESQALIYCRSSTRSHVPRYQQLEGSEYDFNRLTRVLGESGVNSAVVDISTFSSYRHSLAAVIPTLAS